jgi:hypothetical protein
VKPKVYRAKQRSNRNANKERQLGPKNLAGKEIPRRTMLNRRKWLPNIEQLTTAVTRYSLARRRPAAS